MFGRKEYYNVKVHRKKKMNFQEKYLERVNHSSGMILSGKKKILGT